MWPPQPLHCHDYFDVSTAQANRNFGDIPQSSFSKRTFPCWTSHLGWYLGATKSLICSTKFFLWLLGHRSEINVYEWARVAGVLCQSVKSSWGQQPDFQRYNTQDSLQIRCLITDLGTAAGIPRDPPWSVAVAASDTFLHHSFSWVLPRRSPAANSKTLQGKPKCYRWRKLPKHSWFKNKCFQRCKLRLLCQHNNMQGSRAPWISTSQLCYWYHWEEISKPEYPEVSEAFWDEAAAIHRENLCHPPQPAPFPALLTNQEEIQTQGMIGP